MSCSKKLEGIYLIPKGGGAGKMFPPDLFSLPNVKLEREADRIIIDGQEFGFTNLREANEGDGFQVEQRLRTELLELIEQTKGSINQILEQRITQNRTEVIQQVTADTSTIHRIVDEQLRLVSYYLEYNPKSILEGVERDQVTHHLALAVQRYLSSETYMIKVNTSNINTINQQLTTIRGLLDQLKQELLEQIEEAKQEAANNLNQVKEEITTETDNKLQTTKQTITTERAQEIEKVKNELATVRNQEIAQAKSEVKQELRQERDAKLIEAQQQITNATDAKVREAKGEASRKINEAKDSINQRTDEQLRVKLGEARDELIQQHNSLEQRVSTNTAAIANLQQQAQLQGSIAVVGDYKYSAHQVNHNGWLVCDGAPLSTTKYAELFGVIAYRFGRSGDSFLLPDGRGRTLIGSGAGLKRYAQGLLAPSNIGDYRGKEAHQLTTAEMPRHNHQINDPGHQHSTIPGVVAKYAGNGATDRSYSWRGRRMVDIDVNRDPDEWDDCACPYVTTERTNIRIADNGQGTPFELYQPSVVIGNLFIYSGVI